MWPTLLAPCFAPKQEDWAHTEDALPATIMYDASHQRLVSAHQRPCVWAHKVMTQVGLKWSRKSLAGVMPPHKSIFRKGCAAAWLTAKDMRLAQASPDRACTPALQDRRGHNELVRGALFNAAFNVVVSVDEGGNVCVWDVQVCVDVQMGVHRRDAAAGS